MVNTTILTLTPSTLYSVKDTLLHKYILVTPSNVRVFRVPPKTPLLLFSRTHTGFSKIIFIVIELSKASKRVHKTTDS